MTESTAGYSAGAASLRGQRAPAKRWEIRLGTLQVAVWLGLAIGACVGGYFVGFFSGRYVGFESAREGSSGGVLKLPVPELVADARLANSNSAYEKVYDKLKAPAILPESNGPRASANVAEAVRHADANQGDDTAKRPEVPQKITLGQQEVIANSGDDIFEDTGSNTQLIIGADQGADEELEEKISEKVEVKVPASVRMLGSADSEGDTSSSAASILDARIANARSEASQAANVDKVDGQEAKRVAAPEPAGKSAETATPIKKVLPAGFFAQVAAPKKLAEAEAVAKKLKRSGFPVVVESASVNGQSFYRVLVGPEENKVQAERLVDQLQSESYVASKPFIRKVK
ncbi:MAG: SPOR domain-containing protein [Pseudomonadota bacterium]